MASDLYSYSILCTIILVPPTPLWPDLLRILGVNHDLPPYHHPYLGDAQSKGINVIPTLWVIIHALGLGVTQVSAPISMYIQHRIYHYFLMHASVTWNAGVKQMLIYIINVYLILNYADPSSTSSDIISADSDGRETDVAAFAMSMSSNFLLNSSRFSRLMQYTVASSSLSCNACSLP